MTFTEEVTPTEDKKFIRKVYTNWLGREYIRYEVINKIPYHVVRYKEKE